MTAEAKAKTAPELSPVVDIYALTNPQHTPWGVPNRVLYHDVPCKHCYKSVCPEGHHDCLRRVTGQIGEAIDAITGDIRRDFGRPGQPLPMPHRFHGNTVARATTDRGRPDRTAVATMSGEDGAPQ